MNLNGSAAAVRDLTQGLSNLMLVSSYSQSAYSGVKRRRRGLLGVSILVKNSLTKLDGFMTLLLTYLVCNSSSTEIVAAPYISLGYHAIGADMSLAAIEPSSERQEKVVIRDIISADL